METNTKINKQKIIEIEKPENSNIRHSYEACGIVFTVPIKYELIKMIGSGAFGVVVSALNKEKGEKVAIKKISNAFNNKVEATKMIREIKLLQLLQHENIISIKEIFEYTTIDNIVDIYIVTDLLGTDLHKTIYSQQVLTYEHIQYIMYQIVRGVFYMHSANIIHRDLKLDRNCNLKICDLGMARELGNNIKLTQYVITRWYRAPEVLLGSHDYEKPIDIWSIGCIFAELLIRKPLIPGRNYLDQIKKIFETIGTPNKKDILEITGELGLKYILSIPYFPQPNWIKLLPNASQIEIDLLSKMLIFNPKKRITITECINHTYFEGLHENQFISQCQSKYDSNWETQAFTKEGFQQMFKNLENSFQY